MATQSVYLVWDNDYPYDDPPVPVKSALLAIFNDEKDAETYVDKWRKGWNCGEIEKKTVEVDAEKGSLIFYELPL